MGNLFIKYLKLPWRDQILLLQTFVLLGTVRLAILVIPFRYLAVHLGKQRQESSDRQTTEGDFAQQVGWAIALLSAYTPWETKCLVQAITGKLLLRRRRLQNTLYLGVSRNEEHSMIAHAWLRCGKELVTGAQGSEAFTIVAKFADLHEETE